MAGLLDMTSYNGNCAELLDYTKINSTVFNYYYNQYIVELEPKLFMRKYGNLLILLFLFIILIILESSIQVFIFWFVVYFTYLVNQWFLLEWGTELNDGEKGLLELKYTHGKEKMARNVTLDYKNVKNYSVYCKICNEDIKFTSKSYYDIKKGFYYQKMIKLLYLSNAGIMLTFVITGVYDNPSYMPVIIFLGLTIVPLQVLFYFNGSFSKDLYISVKKIISYEDEIHTFSIPKITPLSDTSSPPDDVTVYLCHHCDSEISLIGDTCTNCGKKAPICVICYSDPEPLEEVSQLSCCKSYAHKDHLYDWLEEKSICPYCGKKDPKILDVESLE